MSIAENLYSGLVAAGLKRSTFVSRTEMGALAVEWGQRLAIRSINADARVVELSGRNQRKVVIGKGPSRRSTR